MPEAYQIKDQSAMYFLTFQVVFWLDLPLPAGRRFYPEGLS